MPFNTEPKQIEKVGAEGLKVLWADGHQSLYRWQDLRKACPCAACLPADGSVAGLGSAVRLPEGGVRPLEIKPVGRYALAIRWSDGHTTGIFSFDHLRSLCACEECKPDQFIEG